MTWDAIIVGGGPAGTTTGALLKKYRPDLRVALIERASFPRFHIGESLIIENNRILRDMGALDDVARAGFVPKRGATFVWGESREPWSLRFAESRRLRPDPAGLFDHTWHVERARYDTLLLDVARRHGVEIMQPLAVSDALVEDGSVVGVRTPAGDLRARFVIDASGRAGVIARRVGKRVFDPLLRNVAVYGYWQGAQLEPRYAGHWGDALTTVVSIPNGWIWYIPVAPGRVSVGVVTSAETWRQRSHDPERLYHEALASCPELPRWLEGARCEGELRVERDFNYCHDRLAGPGYLLVGDAGGFVDPLFSIGVFLAQSAAQLAAYFLGAALDGDLDEARLCGAFEHHVRSQIDAFCAMAYVFYSFNSTKEAWWRATRELMRAQALPDDIDDRESFMALTFGFGVNLTLFREAISAVGQLAGPQVREQLLSGVSAPEPELRDFDRQPPLPSHARPRLCVPHTLAPSLIPIEGTGLVLPLTRIELAPNGRAARFPRAIYVPDELAALLPRLDGATEVGALGGGAAAQRLLRALDGMGALA